MLWFLLVPVAFFFIVKDIFWGVMRPDGFLDGMFDVFFTLFFTGIIAGLCAGAASFTGVFFAAHAVQVSDVALVSIRDKDGVEGHFFLGTGFIQSDQYYFYYEKMPDGGFRPGKVRAGSGVRVYEEKRQDARLTTFEWVVDNPLADLIAFPVNAGGYTYYFHVPEGTIRTGYTM